MMIFKDYKGKQADKSIAGIGIFSTDGVNVTVTIENTGRCRTFTEKETLEEYLNQFDDKLIVVMSSNNPIQEQPTVEGSAWDKVVKKFKEKGEKERETVITS